MLTLGELGRVFSLLFFDFLGAAAFLFVGEPDEDTGTSRSTITADRGVAGSERRGSAPFEVRFFYDDDFLPSPLFCLLEEARSPEASRERLPLEDGTYCFELGITTFWSSSPDGLAPILNISTIIDKLIMINNRRLGTSLLLLLLTVCSSTPLPTAGLRRSLPFPARCT